MNELWLEDTLFVINGETAFIMRRRNDDGDVSDEFVTGVTVIV